MFVEAHRREARPSSAADTRTLQIIDAYEAQRTTADGEIAFLRTGDAPRFGELADRTNEIGRQVASGAWAPDGVAEVREQLRAARADEPRSAGGDAPGGGARRGDREGAQTPCSMAARRDRRPGAAAAAALAMEARPSPEQWAKTQPPSPTRRRR